jgi:branched-chain amino acid transport system substrate-binding protein
MDFPGASKQVRFRENGDSGSNYIVFKIENGAYKQYWDPAKGAM